MRNYIFRNFTIETFFNRAESTFSGYGDISTIPSDAESYTWFYQVPVKAQPADVVTEIKDYIQKIALVQSQIPESKPFIVFSLEPLFVFGWQNANLDIKLAAYEFNQYIHKLSRQNSNIKVFNFQDFIQHYRCSEWIDWKFYYLSQMLLNPKLARDFRVWFGAKMEAVLTKRKKCLVLDLDNTLWGGILGEDGIDGIHLGNSYPGNAFRDFQLAILEAALNGVILTVCSKNNETDVLEAWEKNPYMILKKKHFSAYRINWQNKAKNIVELAQELNIGTDSILFLDDNPVERNLVREILPEVLVPEFPEQPYALPAFFKVIYENYFQIHQLTAEDRAKTRQYQENAQRVQFQKTFDSIETYLANLQMELTLQRANPFNIQRIAQMTQKTNQFNLTTHRYSENDIRRFLAGNQQVWCLAVKDKFGDNGITAAAIIKRTPDGQKAIIDTFLLSCRILGRGIENAFLAAILNQLNSSEIQAVEACYCPTAKNVQAANFYDHFGFQVMKTTESGKYYRIELKQPFIIKDYYHIRLE